MATITIPQLNTVTVPTGNDLIEVVQPDVGSASGYSTGKESLSQVANLIANGTQYSGLTTTDQTLVGAINEAAATGGGNEEELTQAEYNALTPVEQMNGTTYFITDGSSGGNRVNFGATSYVNVTDAYYIEYPDYYFVCISVTAAQNIPASTAILTDGPAVTNAQNVPYIYAGSGVFSLGAAVFGTSTNFIPRNALSNGDLIAFSGMIAK